MFQQFFAYVKQYTVRTILILFSIYCLSNKDLWTDFHGYVNSFGIPFRKAILAIVIFLSVTYLLKVARKSFLARVLKHSSLKASIKDGIFTIATYLSVLIAFVISLSVLGVSFKNLGLLLSALSIGLGFGLQHIANNFISGILIMFERPFHIGDWIVINDKEGIVQKINIRSTVLETFDKALVIIPNADIISGELINWTLTNEQGRIKIDVGVAYDSDLEKVLKLMTSTTKNDQRILKNPEPTAIVTEFGDSSINVQLRCFISKIIMRKTIQSDLMIRIHKLFQENNIEIPFPQRIVTVIKPDDDTEKKSA